MYINPFAPLLTPTQSEGSLTKTTSLPSPGGVSGPSLQKSQSQGSNVAGVGLATQPSQGAYPPNPNTPPQATYPPPSQAYAPQAGYPTSQAGYPPSQAGYPPPPHSADVYTPVQSAYTPLPPPNAAPYSMQAVCKLQSVRWTDLI